MSGGELFTHLYQREHFTEDEVRIYIGEVILALEHLHKVSIVLLQHIGKLTLLKIIDLREFVYLKIFSFETRCMDETRYACQKSSSLNSDIRIE